MTALPLVQSHIRSTNLHPMVLGLIGIAKCSGESMVENEILPQCWLQLTHKHIERRLLVAEACVALMPYVSVRNGFYIHTHN